MVRESFEMSNKPQMTRIFTDLNKSKKCMVLSKVIATRRCIELSKFFNLRQSVKSVVDYPDVIYG